MDVWKIGVAISLQNGMSPVLAIIARDLLGLKGHVADVEKGFSAWSGALKGAAQIIAGGMMVDAFAKIAKHGDDLLDQQDKMRRAGIDNLKVLEATSVAYQSIAKAVPTAAGSDILKTVNELSLVTKGNIDEALEYAPKMLKLSALIGNATGRNGGDDAYNMMRAVELHGDVLDPAARDKLLGGMAQAIIGSAGKITGADFYQMASQGGAAFMHSAPDFLTGENSAIMQVLGGAKTGTAMMSAYQFVTGAHTMSKQQVAALNELGLLDMSKVKNDHGRWSLGIGAMKGEENSGNLAKYADENLIPALKAHGAYDDVTKREHFLAKMFPNRNVLKIMEDLVDPKMRPLIDAEVQKFGRAKPTDAAYDSYMKDNPKGVEAGYEAQKKSMLEAIGAPLMQAAIPVMKTFTDVFTQIGAVAQQNSGAVKALGVAFAGLGAGLALLGTYNIGKSLLGLGGSIGVQNVTAGVVNVMGGAGSLAGAAGAAGAAGGMSFMGGLGRMLGAAAGVLGIQTILDAQDQPILDAANRRWQMNHDFPDYGRHNVAPSDRNIYADRKTSEFQSKIAGMKLELPPQKLEVKFQPAPVVLNGRIVGELLGKMFVSQSGANGGSSIHDSAAAPTWHGAH